VLARIRGAWALNDVVEAEQQLERLASELELGITGRLAKTLSSTNPIESMIEIGRHTQRNVKRWQDGDMRKRWTAAGMLQAEQQFRRIVGYSDLATLVTAIEQRHLTLESQNTPQPPEVRTDTVTSEDAAQLVTV
jgi:putative transposase